MNSLDVETWTVHADVVCTCIIYSCTLPVDPYPLSFVHAMIKSMNSHSHENHGRAGLPIFHFPGIRVNTQWGQFTAR